MHCSRYILGRSNTCCKRRRGLCWPVEWTTWCRAHCWNWTMWRRAVQTWRRCPVLVMPTSAARRPSCRQCLARQRLRGTVLLAVAFEPRCSHSAIWNAVLLFNPEFAICVIWIVHITNWFRDIMNLIRDITNWIHDITKTNFRYVHIANCLRPNSWYVHIGN